MIAALERICPMPEQLAPKQNAEAILKTCSAVSSAQYREAKENRLKKAKDLLRARLAAKKAREERKKQKEQEREQKQRKTSKKKGQFR